MKKILIVCCVVDTIGQCFSNFKLQIHYKNLVVKSMLSVMTAVKKMKTNKKY